MEEIDGSMGEDSVMGLRDRLIRDGLVAGMKYAEAGASASVSERTVRRLMADESFRGEVHALRAERMSRLADLFSELGGEAHRVLAELLQDDNPGVRARAAQIALSMGARFRREAEITDRIETLERRIEALFGSDGGHHAVA